ncbi:MAG: hypothetical protein IPG63_04645 [Xanthomonadales bacterium]|nr:hypothetical protein [Xanthomonadales bacterium]
MKTRRLATLARTGLIISSLLLAGCQWARNSTVGEVVQVDPVSSYYGQPLEDGMATTKQKIDCGKGSENTASVCNVSYWIARAGNRMETRNSTQSELIILSNEVCQQHLSDVFGTSAVINVTGSFTSMLLSGAAAIVSGRAGQNMSAAASIISGTQSSINSEIYQGLLVGAIIAEIQGTRSSAYAEIKQRRSQAVDVYSPAEAVSDALAYHDLCSFYMGVTSLVKKAGRTTRETDPFVQATINAKSELLTNIGKLLADLEPRIAALEGKAALAEGEQEELESFRKRRRQLVEQRIALTGELDRYRALTIPSATPPPSAEPPAATEAP